MTEKMRAYLDGIFAVVPSTDEVKEAKEELFAGMVERYNDCLMEGMDEQQAYDNVIESIGDIRELFSEMDQNPANAGTAPAADSTDSYYNPWGEPQTPESEGEEKPGGFNLNDVVQNVTDFTSGLFSSLFSTGDPAAAQELVNTRTLSLAEVSVLDVGYISEPITLLKSEDDQFMLKEYMNRNQPELHARIELRGNKISIRNGRRQGVFGLRSRVELYVPASYANTLQISTVSGSIISDEEWKLASLQARTVSGEVKFNAVECDGTLRLASTSGSVKLEKGTGTMELHSISGSVRVNEAAGSGSFKTTSGSVRVDFTALSGNVDASTVSGGVRLTMPDSAAFELDGRSVSGGIYTAFDNQLTFERRNKAHGFVGRAPYHHVRVASTSGSIHIND